jgi:lysophospholipase L1-like esterase
MKRAIPWIFAAVAVLGLAASFFELQRERGRQQRHHALFREFVIRSDLAEAKAPILVIGDSITEGAKLPREIAGRAGINGGISDATVEDFERIAPVLVAAKPSFVVIALATNGTAESLRASYPALLHQLKALTPNIMAVGVTPQVEAESKNAAIKAAADREGIHFFTVPMPAGSTRLDGVHLSDAGYQAYTPALAAEISAQIGRARPKAR